MPNNLVYRNFSPKLRYSFLLAAVFLSGYILVRSLTPMQASVSVAGLDKVVHLGAYCALGILWLPALPRLNPAIIWIGLAAFGASIEFAQGAMSAGRSADLWDEIANMSGAALALLFWLILTFFWAKLRSAKNERH